MLPASLLLALACTPPDAPEPSPSTRSTPTEPPADTAAVASTADTAEPIPAGPVDVAHDDPALTYIGRIPVDADSADLIWPGSQLVFEATAPIVELTLFDADGLNQIAVVIDGADPIVVPPARGERVVRLAEALSDGPHRVEVHKRTEALEGPLEVRGLRLPEGGRVAAVPAPALRLEFYGDSITSGYSVDCACDDGDPAHKNHYDTYAARTTRALGGAHHSLSISGVGLIRSWWFPNMQEYWDDVALEDDAWDFADWPADVVIVNLGQNDHWLGAGPDLAPAYVAFGEQLRSVHPDAAIFFVIGSMDAASMASVVPDQLQAAVDTLRARGDTDVHAHVFPYVPGGHPVSAVHAQLADELTEVLRATLGL